MLLKKLNNYIRYLNNNANRYKMSRYQISAFKGIRMRERDMLIGMLYLC
jgi:hypothetical protein